MVPLDMSPWVEQAAVVPASEEDPRTRSQMTSVPLDRSADSPSMGRSGQHPSSRPIAARSVRRRGSEGIRLPRGRTVGL